MNLEELKSEIMNNSEQTFYIFNGEEYALKRIYINEMSSRLKLPVKCFDTLEAVYPLISGNDLFDEPSIYVVFEDEDYRQAEKSWKGMLNLQSKSRIILAYNNLDKRTAFYKAHENCLVDFKYLSDEILVPRVMAMAGFSESVAKRFVAICGHKYGRILLELEKLKNLADVEGVKLETALFMAMEQGAIHEEVGDIVFSFIDSVVLRNPKLAYKQLNKLYSVGESDVKLLSLLYTSFRNALIVKFTPQPKWEDVLGLKEWQCRNVRAKNGKYTAVELLNIVKFLREVETKVKSGKLESDKIIEYILAKIM